jgi:UMF1 family MFS transporter
MNFNKNDKKVLRSWVMYDWANSVYSLTIISAVFPAYFEAVTDKNVIFFGREFENTALYSYAISFSFFIISLSSPILSGIADFKGNKKKFMKFFVYLGATACALMYFFVEGRLQLGIWTSVIASIGFAGSLVFYNAFLPEIATSDKFDRLSARGFSMGYIGSVILLLVNLIMIMFHESLGLSEGMSSRIAFLTVAVWWIGFSQYSFKNLPDGTESPSNGNILLSGYRELISAWKLAKEEQSIKLYLFAFFFYSMGVQTVMYLATLFGTSELNLDTQNLIIAILLIQIIAVGGAYLFSKISSIKGNIFSLIIAVIFWMFICFYTYFYVVDATTFYIDACLVGLVMGGIQSLSRSTFSKLIPSKKDFASFFSLYEISEKIAIVLGTLSFGLIIDITGGMRNSVLALGYYFFVGLVALFLVKDSRLKPLSK